MFFCVLYLFNLFCLANNVVDISIDVIQTHLMQTVPFYNIVHFQKLELSEDQAKVIESSSFRETDLKQRE